MFRHCHISPKGRSPPMEDHWSRVCAGNYYSVLPPQCCSTVSVCFEGQVHRGPAGSRWQLHSIWGCQEKASQRWCWTEFWRNSLRQRRGEGYSEWKDPHTQNHASLRTQGRFRAGQRVCCGPVISLSAAVSLFPPSKWQTGFIAANQFLL